MRESDLELSSDPEDRYYESDHYRDEECDEYGYYPNYFTRVNDRGGYPGFRRGSRGRWPRSWRGRSRSSGYPGYHGYYDHDDWRHDHVGTRDLYQDMYLKYFESVADREATNKEGSCEERRPREEYRDRKEFEDSRERETSHRLLPKDRSGTHVQEQAYGDNDTIGLEFKDLRSTDRLRANSDWTGDFDQKGRGNIDRKSYNESHKGNLEDYAPERRGAEKHEQKHIRVEETDVRKHDLNINLNQRHSRERLRHDREEGEGARKDHVLRERERHGELGDRSRRGMNYDSGSRLPISVAREGNKRYGVMEKPHFEIKREREDNKNASIDMRWKNQVLRADIEREKKDVSVKDRLSFGIVKCHSDFNFNEKRPKQNISAKSMKQRQDVELTETRRQRENEHSEIRGRLNMSGNKTKGRRDVQLKEPRARRDIICNDRRVRSDIRHTETKERSDIEQVVRDRHDLCSEIRKKRDRGEASQMYKSGSESDHSESHRKRQHGNSSRKRRKRRKKKRDERSDDGRKHKHKKKKKKRGSGRD